MTRSRHVVEVVNRLTDRMVWIMLMWLRLVFRWQAIWSYFQRPSLPCKPIEPIYSSRRILSASHQDCPIPSTPIIGSQADICPQHRPCFSEQVLQILPSDAVWQVANKEVDTPVQAHRCRQEVGHQRCDRPVDAFRHGIIDRWRSGWGIGHSCSDDRIDLCGCWRSRWRVGPGQG